ncbi:MAG TPA: FMN-binding protein [Gammaproteobacteria bacterium]|nr:FMN-binding protein [Gammaproteobacteria bacterium]
MMFKLMLFFAGAPSGALMNVRLKAHLPVIFICLMCLAPSTRAENIYQTSDDFVNESFAGKPPEAEVLWLQDDLKKQLEDILDHGYEGKRVRYWKQGQRSVWVLEEIGKTKPITTGIVINNKKIEAIKVLVFRESRGWEIKYPFFTEQFTQAGLTHEHKLDRSIDGISGATLSVRALTKLARIALLLDQQLKHS